MIDRLRREPERLAGWVALAVWVAQPFTLGPLLGAALDPTRDLFRTGTTWALWIGWLLVLVALVVPRPLTLSVARILGVVALPAAIWAALTIDDTARIVLGLLSAAVVVAVLVSPTLADRFVDGASYGDERRFALRPPGPVLIGLIGPSWALAVAGYAAGPLFLLDEQWVVGAVLVAIGFPPAFFATRALHQLTNRFLVFVPHGLVVHDLTVMREPVLFTTAEIAGLAPAPADTTADDMTSAALGLALQLTLAGPFTVAAVVDRSTTEERDVRALLIAPSRPAAVMRLARQRGIRIV